MKAWIIKDPYGRKPPEVKVQDDSPVPKYFDKPLFDECEEVKWEEVYIHQKPRS
jgi:hypothetical protein